MVALLVLGLFLWCCLTRRRRRTAQGQPTHQQHRLHVFEPAPYPPTYHTASISAAHSPMTATAAASPSSYEQQHLPLPKASHWTASPHNDAFTGFKNELPADEIRPAEMASPELGEVVVPSSPAGREIGTADSETSETMRSQDYQRRDVTGGYYLSPQSTGSETHRSDEAEHGNRGPPSEMQG